MPANEPMPVPATPMRWMRRMRFQSVTDRTLYRIPGDAATTPAARAPAGSSAARHRCSVRRPVLVREPQRPVGRAREGEVVVRVLRRVPRDTVADLEVDDVAAAAVHELVGGAAGQEARAHAGAEDRLDLVRQERRLALEDVEELLLLRVRVPERRVR